MKVYRISRIKHLDTALSGIGSALSKHSRWNSQHRRIVYTSASRALAMLEIIVHLSPHEDLPTDRVFLEIDIPEEIPILAIGKSQLPARWNSYPSIRTTQLIGDAFLTNLESPILRVPSAIVPQEYNYLINPMHPLASKIAVTSTETLRFDTRLI